jgi:predicted lipase
VGNNSATGFVAIDNTKKQIVLSMRGSVSLSNWIADIKYFQTDCAEYGGKNALCSIGFLGFWEQSRPEALKGIEQGFREHPDYQLVITGHSLGGAAAVYAASEFRKKYKNVLLVFSYPL